MKIIASHSPTKISCEVFRMKLSKKDMLLIRCLRSNARATLTQISKETKIPISTLFDKLKTHQGDIIAKHTSLINFDKLGYHARVQIFLKAPLEIRDRLANYLQHHEQINSVFEITNGFDFLVEGVFTQVHEAENFLADLEFRFSPLEYNTHYIIQDLKREEFLNKAY